MFFLSLKQESQSKTEGNQKYRFLYTINTPAAASISTPIL
jgi:hypothetical protein